MDLIYGMAEEPGSLHRYLYAIANPVNRSDPSGLVSNFVYGQRVHQILGFDFVDKNPLERDADLGINAILGDVIPFVGKLRPDLIDYYNKQIYEIKTVRQYAQGLTQLTGYLLILNWADPTRQDLGPPASLVRASTGIRRSSSSRLAHWQRPLRFRP